MKNTIGDLKEGDTLIFNGGITRLFKGWQDSQNLGPCRKFIAKDGDVQLLSSRMNDVKIQKVKGKNKTYKWL